jgi:NADH dehydrogenase (ubiquinone) 1 alpha/beta subcomplex 1
MQMTESASFQDLGLDSLDTVELVMAFAEEFAVEIPDAEADKISSCSEVIGQIVVNPCA